MPLDQLGHVMDSGECLSCSNSKYINLLFKKDKECLSFHFVY